MLESFLAPLESHHYYSSDDEVPESTISLSKFSLEVKKHCSRGSV